MESLIRRLEQVAMGAAGLCVTAIMLVVCYDAFGRYAFGAPLSWAFDVVSNYLMVGAAYFALSATFRRGDHININLIHDKLPRPLRVAVDVVWGLLAALLFGAIAWGTAVHAIEAYQNKEFIPGVVMWPVWLSYAPIPIGAGLMVLRLLHHVATLAVHGEDPHVQTEGEGAVE